MSRAAKFASSARAQDILPPFSGSANGALTFQQLLKMKFCDSGLDGLQRGLRSSRAVQKGAGESGSKATTHLNPSTPKVKRKDLSPMAPEPNPKGKFTCVELPAVRKLRYHENALALFHTQSLVHGGVLQFPMCSMKMGSCQNHVLTHVNCLSKVCTKGRDVKFHHPA